LSLLSSPLLYALWLGWFWSIFWPGEVTAKRL
jgi:hypothetical protein